MNLASLRTARFVPMVARELRGMARRPSTHHWRVGFSAAGLVALVGAVFFSVVPDAERGRQLYFLVSLCGLVYALVMGVLLTADAVNHERAQGTLGLLFLTDLRSRDILLGKLVATSLNGTYILVGLLPLLAIPLMFGGVALTWVLGHGLLLLATLTLSLAVGLHASTVCPDTGRAIAKGLMTMLVVNLLPLPFAIGEVSFLGVASPAYAYFRLFEATTPGTWVVDLACSLGFPLLLAMTVFWNAAARLTPEDPAPAQPAMLPVPAPANAPPVLTGEPSRPLIVAGQRGSAPPPGLLETDPIMWLLWRRNRFPRADAAMIGTLALVAVPALLGALANSLSWYAVAVGGFVLHAMTVSHMASQACQRIRTEEDRTALELLLTTPRAAQGTFASYHRAFCQLFQMQFLALLILHGMLLIGALVNGSANLWLVPAIAMAVLFAERRALSWIGLNLSLRHGRYHRALAGTLLGVALPSWGAVLLVLMGSNFRLNVSWWLWLFAGGVVPLVLAAVHQRQAERWLQQHGGIGTMGGGAHPA